MKNNVFPCRPSFKPICNSNVQNIFSDKVLQQLEIGTRVKQKRRLIRILQLHCVENPIYLFPEMKLRSLAPNFYMVSDLYIPRIGLPIWLQQNRQTDPGNI